MGRKLKISDLEQRFHQPANLEWGTFDQLPHRAGGNAYTLRYAKISARDRTKGYIVLLHGFSEFAEKYFELMSDLTEQDYTVFSFDWMGQGKSTRYMPGHPERAHSEGFDLDIKDMHSFIEAIVPDDRPRYLIGHSMGGHLGLRYLHDYPTTFKAACLSAPMCGFDLPAPRGFILFLVRLLRLHGLKASSGADWSKKYPDIENDPRSKDPARRGVHYAYCLENAGLRMKDISFGWVYHALRSIQCTEKSGYLETIQTPILMGQAGAETTVDNHAMDQAVKRLSNARVIKLENAVHELFMERDDIRGVFLRETLSFLEKHG